MPWSDWIGSHWTEILQTGGVIGALLLTGFAVFLDARTRRVGNLIQLTRQHRELWEGLFGRPELARILDPDSDLSRTPVTAEEELFVIFIILHLSNTFYAMRTGFFRRPRGLRKDIQLFFSLPLPHSVWKRVRNLQERSFVKFVEACLPTTDRLRQ